MPEQALEEPKLLLNPTYEHHELISRLDEFIKDRPHRFLIALGQLGDVGITGAQPGEGPSGPGEVELLTHIFEERADHALEFDEATEDYLASDHDQRALIERMQNQRARTKGKNEKVQVEDNPGAIRYRDIIRRRRLAIFAQRTIEWQEATEAPQVIEVPSIPRQTAPHQTKASLGAVA